MVPPERQPRRVVIFFAAVCILTAVALAQFRETTPPKQYPWSDTSLSPDARADLVLKKL
jgi:hypothetical protein